MVRYESLITALIGGVLGLALGIVGAILVRELVLSGTGYVLVIRSPRWSCCSGSPASPACSPPSCPARRAARLDMLGALASE